MRITIDPMVQCHRNQAPALKYWLNNECLATRTACWHVITTPRMLVFSGNNSSHYIIGHFVLGNSSCKQTGAAISQVTSCYCCAINFMHDCAFGTMFMCSKWLYITWLMHKHTICSLKRFHTLELHTLYCSVNWSFQ